MQYKKPGIESFTVKPGKFRDKPAPQVAFGEALSGITGHTETAPSIAQHWCSVMYGRRPMALAQGFQAPLHLVARELAPARLRSSRPL
ncbi:hypothetical protein D3C78_1662920 [compost metagenome]